MDSKRFEQSERLKDGRYLIVRPLRLGGLGAVYEARDTFAPAQNQHCAIKETLLNDGYGVPAGRPEDDFIRRCELLETLQHPHLARLYDYFTLDDRAYVVMEFVQGRDLEDILADVSYDLPVDALHQWAIQLCDVLDYLHSRQPYPVIYRDLKPSNIMIDPRLTVQLIDFGIADVFPDGHTGHPLGTDGYAAPEQYDGVVTPQTDIYALGATLHHLVTHVDPRLEPPFSFIDRPIRVYNPDISPALEAVIMRALAQSPAYRFGSAREMMEAIKSAPESRSG